jgi:hypothetical protein
LKKSLRESCGSWSFEDDAWSQKAPETFECP